MSSVRRTLSALVLAVSALLPLSEAHAQSVERPLRVAVGLGPAFVLDGGAQFLLTQEVDYRLLPSSIGHLFIGGALGEGISGAFIFQVGARVGYDFRVFENDAVEVLVAPEVMLGAAFADVGGGSGFFDLQVGAEARVVFLDGLLGVWLRPIAFDFFIQERTIARYNLLAGASLQF